MGEKLANKAETSLSTRTTDSNMISDTSLGMHKLSQAAPNIGI